MSDLVVLAFKDQGGAGRFSAEIQRMQKMQILKLEDAAIVTRDAGGKAKVKQANSLVGAGAFGGAFWGMLIGLLFFMPWLGLAMGAISGALAGKFSDIGIDDEFIKTVGSEIPPGLLRDLPDGRRCDAGQGARRIAWSEGREGSQDLPLERGRAEAARRARRRPTREETAANVG